MMKAYELDNKTNHLHTFMSYEQKFKALIDQHDIVCVCDVIEMIHLPQSRLSYRLRI